MSTYGQFVLPGQHAALAPFLTMLTGLAVVAVAVPRGLQLSPAEWAMGLALTVLVIVRQTLLALRRRPAARRASVPRSAGPAGPPPAAPVGAPFPGAAVTSDHRAELQALSLQIAAAARPTAQERVSRVSTSLATGLGVTAGALAMWDLGLLLTGLARAGGAQTARLKRATAPVDDAEMSPQQPDTKGVRR